MTYRIARDGKIFGPYTDTEVRRYLASGNIAPSDLIQPEGSIDWVPVAQLFPETAPMSGAPSGKYLDPPDLPWGVALLLGVVTGGLFFVVWDIVQAAWMRRVQPASKALTLYIAIAVLYLVRMPANVREIKYDLFGGPPLGPHHGFITFLVWLGLFIASRTVIRRDLLRHFNGPEPVGLRLSSFLTYLLGGLYFQYHFNRINERKRASHTSVPAAT